MEIFLAQEEDKKYRELLRLIEARNAETRAQRVRLRGLPLSDHSIFPPLSAAYPDSTAAEKEYNAALAAAEHKYDKEFPPLTK